MPKALTTTPYPRLRRTDSRKLLQPFYRTYTYKNGTKSVETYPGWGARIGELHYCSDVVTPGHKSIIARGGIINNPFCSHKESYEQKTSGFVLTIADPNATALSVVTDAHDNVLAEKLPALGSFFSEYHERLYLECIAEDRIEQAKTLCATKALSNLNKQNFQSLAWLGELRKTVDLIKNPIKAITDYLRKPWRTKKKVHLKGRGKVWVERSYDPLTEIIPLGNAGASQYLAYYYGLRNLIFDAQRVVDSVERLARIRRRTSSKVALSGAKSENRPLHSGSSWAYGEYQYSTQENVDIEAGIIFSPVETSALDEFGISVYDIPSTVFELTPYSFCADWVTNLGTWVNTIGVESKYDIQIQWLKEVRTKTVNRKALRSSFTFGPYASGGPCTDEDSASFKTTNRYPVNLGDMKGIAIKLDIDPPVLAAASLVIQLITKGR